MNDHEKLKQEIENIKNICLIVEYVGDCATNEFYINEKDVEDFLISKFYELVNNPDILMVSVNSKKHKQNYYTEKFKKEAVAMFQKDTGYLEKFEDIMFFDNYAAEVGHRLYAETEKDYFAWGVNCFRVESEEY